MIKIIIQIWMLDLHRNKAKLENKNAQFAPQ